MTATVVLILVCAVTLAVLGYLLWRGDEQINDANRGAFGTTDPPDTSAAGTSHVTVISEYLDHAKSEADKRRDGGAA